MKYAIVLSLVWVIFVNAQQVFITLNTDVNHARVTIVQDAMSRTTFQKLKSGEIKRSELPDKGTPISVTTPLRSYRIGANQIIRLIVKKKGFNTYDEFIEIGSSPKTVDLSAFRPKSKIAMTLKNMIIPGWGQFHTDRGGAGFGFMALEVLIGGAAGYCYYTSEQHYSDFLDFRSQYEQTSDPATFMGLAQKRDDSKELYENYHNYMNYALYAAGAVWVWAIFDGFINAPGKNDAYAVSVQPGRERFLASLTIAF